MPAIHQFVGGYTKADAISNEAALLRKIFRSWGYDSHIFAEPGCTHPELRKDALDVKSFAASADDIVLLHLSTGSVVNEIFATVPCRKAILYHNITPAEYFSAVQKQIARGLDVGKRQIGALAGIADVNLADSQFNADELATLGYSDVKVLPLILDLQTADSRVDRRTVKQLDDGRTNIIFVGRCAPNKKIEDLISAFAFFQKAVEPNSRFVHVGSYVGLERYHYLLFSMVREMQLRDVKFAGSVTQQELNAYYRSASLFLCMSEHEGFCIPVLESMAHDVPVMAYAAAAVPETMDGAGIVFSEKDFPSIAEMMGHLVKDQALRAGVLSGQRDRIARYRARDLEGELRQHLAPLLKSL